MYSAFLERTKETILALSKHISTSERYRSAVFDGSLQCAAGTPCFDQEIASTDAAPDRLEWRIIDHCAAVTRIYAIYEQFVHEMIREHVALLQAHLMFSDLPESLRLSYRSGIAKILDKKDGPRFGDLNLEQLIGGYDQALKGFEYTLEPRAILMQEQNLRMPELNRFLGACGVSGVEHWIEHHKAIRDFFAGDNRLTGSADSELGELIKYRNDAAHGSIDIGDILHVNVLAEFCDFIAAVCEALSERVQLAGLKVLKAHGHVRERGKLTESLKDGRVGIGAMIGVFRVGATVYLCGENYCVERSIISLQIESAPHQEVKFGEAAELGLLFDAPVRKNATLMAFEERASEGRLAETDVATG